MLTPFYDTVEEHIEKMNQADLNQFDVGYIQGASKRVVVSICGWPSMIVDLLNARE